MKVIWILPLLFCAMVGAIWNFVISDGVAQSQPAPASIGSSDRLGWVAANGVIEGARPEVDLRPEVAGTIAALHVRENAEVKQGDLLVELHNETQKAQVALAESDVAEAKAALERLRNGHRKEERQAAAATEKAQAAVCERAKAEWERQRELRNSRAVSREQSEAAYFRWVRARGLWEQAKAELALVEAPPRREDIEVGEARLAGAQARLALAREQLAQTRLVAPTAGRVLRVYVEPGEMASPESPQPTLVLADLSRRRVRAFIEELDIDRVRVGQGAVVSADGIPDRDFQGQVAELLPSMGKQAPESDRPDEYKDVYFREVLIDLEGGENLPVRLRVRVRIDPSTEV
jgi:multidrug resistance efflux pump